MVVGNGMLATAFMKTEGISSDTIIFASGVSNSQETDHREFRRESDLLHSFLSCGKRVVYFSTVSVHDPSLSSSPYIIHKLNIEHLLREHAGDYLIIRLPIVVGRSNNRHTLTNFLFYSLLSGHHFELYRFACRYLIDLEDVVALVTRLIAKQPCNQTLDLVLDNRTRVTEIVEVLEHILGTQANYTLVPKGACYQIDNGPVKHILGTEYFQVDPRAYTYSLLSKYYLNI